MNAEQLYALFGSLIPPTAKRAPQTKAEENRVYRAKRKKQRKLDIAVLDMETDPFDNDKQTEILPFLAVLYSDQFETIIIWEDDFDCFVEKLYQAIVSLPRRFTIYAHNGGKFDFMFLLSKLRGEVSFKGRGIMRADIAGHELRDSYHIIPEKLAAYKKDKFDYSKLTRKERSNYRQTTIDYCIADCRYLLDLVKKFIDEYGFKISIGAAALAKVGEHYHVERTTSFVDEKLRMFYVGGRVECLAGAGYFSGDYKLYDVNSMYPFVMATCKHPIGSEYIFRDGEPGENTCFVKLECENFGALLGTDAENKRASNVNKGTFLTSVYEYKTAKDLNLIADIRVLECVDTLKQTTFSSFVLPLYEQRAKQKEILEQLLPDSAEYDRVKAEILFLKLIMNNAYGKFAQNPRNYKKYFFTDPGERPLEECDTWGDVAKYEGEKYWIWEKPDPGRRFHNVGTAASITGAARAVLMRAIHSAKNPIYCDTDSLICEELRDHQLDKFALGAWDLEKEISECIILGRKLYGYKDKQGKETIRSKGTNGLKWDDLLKMLLKDDVITRTNFAPTLTRYGSQSYISRRIRRTADRRSDPSQNSASLTRLA